MTGMRTAAYATRRLIIRARPTREHIEAVIAAHRWPMVTDISFPDLGARETSWRVGQRLAVYYTDDVVVRACGVDVRGSDPAGAEALLAGLAADLDVYTAEDLLHAVDQATTSDETMRAVFRLTFAAHPTRADPAVVDRVTKTLRHTDPAVRAATAFAMANTDWPSTGPYFST
jgi:hypothetical protein